MIKVVWGKSYVSSVIDSVMIRCVWGKGYVISVMIVL